MIKWLASKRWGRLVLFPFVVAACAFSWAAYVVGKVPDDKQGYWRNAWGWLSPELEPHWKMLAGSDPARGSTFHELKNIGAEYCRAWPQTAAKAGSFLAVSVVLDLIVIGGILWAALL